MSNLNEILSTTPQTLAELQRVRLEQHVVTILKQTITAIKDKRYSKIPTGNSPAGDGWGCDNTFINFSWDQEERDIMDIIIMLEKLDGVIKSV